MISMNANLEEIGILGDLVKTSVGFARLEIEGEFGAVLGIWIRLLTSHNGDGNSNEGTRVGRTSKAALNFRVERLARAGFRNIENGSDRNLSVSEAGIAGDLDPWLGGRKDEVIFEGELFRGCDTCWEFWRDIEADFFFTDRNVTAKVKAGAVAEGVVAGADGVELIPLVLLRSFLEELPRGEGLDEAGSLGEDFDVFDKACAVHERGANAGGRVFDFALLGGADEEGTEAGDGG